MNSRALSALLVEYAKRGENVVTIVMHPKALFALEEEHSGCRVVSWNVGGNDTPIWTDTDCPVDEVHLVVVAARPAQDRPIPDQCLCVGAPLVSEPRFTDRCIICAGPRLEGDGVDHGWPDVGPDVEILDVTLRHIPERP